MVSPIQRLCQSVRVGERMDSGPLSFFPLSHGEQKGMKEVVTLEEGMKKVKVIMSELDENEVISEIVVYNVTGKMLFILEGEGIEGGFQDRVFTTSLLVPSRGLQRMSVRCVESGRWCRTTKLFTPGHRASTGVRRQLVTCASQASETGRDNFENDQVEVWDQIEEEFAAQGAASETRALRDVYEHAADRIDPLLEAIRLPQDCTGVAVAAGGKLIGLEILGSASLWRRHEKRILRSFAVDALQGSEVPPTLDGSTVKTLLDRIAELPETTAPSPGVGTQRRMKNDDLLVTAIEHAGCVYHLSAII